MGASFVLVSGLTLLSTATGFVREVITGRSFGATGETDAFFAAFGFVSLVYFLLSGGAVQGAFMPQYQKLYEGGHKNVAAALFLRVLRLLGGITCVIMVLIFIFSDQLVAWLYPGFDAEIAALTSDMIRTLSPLVVLLGLGSVFQSVLHSRSQFLWPAIIPVAINLIVITTIIFFGDALGVRSLSFGYLAGNVLWIVLLLPFCLRFLSGRGQVSAATQNVVFSAFGFLAFLLLVDQVSGILQRALLSQFEAGLISAFTYGTRVAGLPIGILIGGLTVVIFPRLISEISASDHVSHTPFVGTALASVVCLVIPAAGFVFFNAALIIQTIFGGSAFSAEALANTVLVLQIYAAAMPAQALILFGAKVHIAAGRNRDLLMISLIAGAVQLLLTYLLPRTFGWVGVPIATFLYAHVHMILLIMNAHRRVPFALQPLLGSLARIICAAIISFSVYLVLDGSTLLLLALSTSLATALFFIILYLTHERSLAFLFERKPH